MGRHPGRMSGRPLIGAHVSIAGGFPRAVERAAAGGCAVFQVFVKSPSQWRAAPLSDAECRAFREALARSGLRCAAAHDAYLINLASPDPALWKKSKEALREEMARCARLGIPALVAHPGSPGEAGEAFGLRRVGRALLDALADPRGAGVRILLETTSGQGRCLGGRFEHLKELLERVAWNDRVGICFDTCHVFAAGYDLRKKRAWEETFRALDRVVGLSRIALFHLNDSKGECGSRTDRHDHIGKGRIGPDLFEHLVRSRRFRSVPKVIETPGGVEGGAEDKRNIAVLFGFAGP